MARNRDEFGGTEFGGVRGLIQPLPHQPTTTETLMQVYATDPAATPEDEAQFIPETQKRR